jgi:hypothetical protein
MTAQRTEQGLAREGNLETRTKGGQILIVGVLILRSMNHMGKTQTSAGVSYTYFTLMLTLLTYNAPVHHGDIFFTFFLYWGLNPGPPGLHH